MGSSFRVRAMPTCKETPAAPAQAAETSAEAAELSWMMAETIEQWPKAWEFTIPNILGVLTGI